MNISEEHQDSNPFTSQSGLLDQYGDLFQKVVIENNPIFIEQKNNSNCNDIFRIFLTEAGVIAVSSDTQFPQDREAIWNLMPEDPAVQLFLISIYELLKEKEGIQDPKDLSGFLPNLVGYSYKIFRYHNNKDSSALRYCLNKKRIMYQAYKVLQGV